MDVSPSIKQRAAAVALILLAGTFVAGPASAQEPPAETGSCYSALPADGWDFDAIAATKVECTAPHKYEVFSVFSIPAMPGAASKLVARQRLYALTSCADAMIAQIGLTSVASHYALEAHAVDGTVSGVCGVVALGRRPDVPVVTTVPYRSADLTTPLCVTGVMGLVACDSRKAAGGVDSAALFYPLSSIVSAKPFPGAKATTRRAKRIARGLEHRNGFEYYAPRTKRLWNNSVRMVYVYHRL